MSELNVTMIEQCGPATNDETAVGEKAAQQSQSYLKSNDLYLADTPGNEPVDDKGSEQAKQTLPSRDEPYCSAFGDFSRAKPLTFRPVGAYSACHLQTLRPGADDHRQHKSSGTLC